MKSNLKAKMLLATALLSSGGVALAAGALQPKEEKPGLLARAQLTADQAVQAAHGRVPDGKAESVEIEEEGGRLVFSVELETQRGDVEVLVDAQTGTVVAVEQEQEQEQDQDESEGNEASDDD